jgi:uncharacterized SAM-binding protein YcdF (DUF218 family)
LIRRIILLASLCWILGLAWFAVALPGPGGSTRTDGVVVLTGGKGRLARGIDVLQQGWSRHLLVSGVDRTVQPGEFLAANHVPRALLNCCIELGKQATNTVSNAGETADWIRRNHYRSVRLITTDWHMRRARLELSDALNGDASIVADGVPSTPGLGVIILEYHKYLIRRVSILFGL